MNKDVAKVALERAIAQSADLNELARYLRDHPPEQEFKPYRRGIAKIMGEILMSVINPIVDEHPDLTPPGLRRESN